MKLLLDTHTLIWAATLDDKLSATAQSLLLNNDNVWYLSMASVWEMAIKVSLGKLILKQSIEDIIREQAQINGLKLLHIDMKHAVAVSSLPWYHRDPFDRLIICQSQVEDMTILGCDKAMDAYGVDRAW